MKKIVAGILFLISTVAIVHATVTIEVDAGILRNATGTADVPAGGLLQIICSPSGSASNFGAPTSTSFTSGDNVVLASFSMNYNVATGVTDNTFTFTLQNTGPATSTTIDAGDPLLLRWYPTLTTSSTAPGLGVTYGQFRSNTGENGGSAWVIPADGTSLFAPQGLNFFTTDVPTSTGITGSHAPNAGYASSIVVPEPSTYVISGVLVGLFVVWNLKHRKA